MCQDWGLGTPFVTLSGLYVLTSALPGLAYGIRLWSLCCLHSAPHTWIRPCAALCTKSSVHGYGPQDPPWVSGESCWLDDKRPGVDMAHGPGLSTPDLRYYQVFCWHAFGMTCRNPNGPISLMPLYYISTMIQTK